MKTTPSHLFHHHNTHQSQSKSDDLRYPCTPGLTLERCRNDKGICQGLPDCTDALTKPWEQSFQKVIAPFQVPVNMAFGTASSFAPLLFREISFREVAIP